MFFTNKTIDIYLSSMVTSNMLTHSLTFESIKFLKYERSSGG